MKSKFIGLFPYLIIIGLVLFILQSEGCLGTKKGDIETVKIDGKKYEVVKRVIDTFYSEKTVVQWKKGKDELKVIEVAVPTYIPQNVDTGAILQKYYSKYVSEDTFTYNDSFQGKLVIVDTISQNRILGRSTSLTIKIPTIREQVFLRDMSRVLWVGPSLQLSRNPAVGINLNLENEKDYLLGIGVGINTLMSPYVSGSFSWKISK